MRRHALRCVAADLHRVLMRQAQKVVFSMLLTRRSYVYSGKLFVR